MTAMNPKLVQDHYRIRTDTNTPDGGTPTWAGDEDSGTRVVISTGTTFRVRFVVSNTGNANLSTTFSLYYSLQGGAYTEITASTPVQYADASTVADDTTIATGNFVLTAGTGTASAGTYDENNAIGQSLNSGDYTEVEFGLTIDAAQVADTNTIDLRVYESDTAFPDMTDPGSYTNTAIIEVNEPVNTAITPPVGAMVLAGLAPTVTKTEFITITPDTGALALTGQTPVRGYGMQIVGYAPTVTVAAGDNNITRNVPAGAMTLAGLVPGVAVTENKTAAPDTGAVVVTGQTPTVRENIIITVPTGSMVLAGVAPTVQTNFVVSPDPEVLVLAGIAPTIARTDNHVRAPPVGSMVMTGIAPLAVTSEGKTADPNAGSLTLSGLAPSVQRTENQWITPDTGAMALAGIAPLAISGDNKVASPPAGAMVLAGLAPTPAVTENQWITPDTGTVAISGLVSTLAYSWVVRPPTGTLSLTGIAPAAVSGDNRLASPPTGSMVLAGIAPTLDVSQNHRITPDAGAITVTGYAPFRGYGMQLVGYAPTVTVSGPAAKTITPDTGTLTLAGLTPTVIAPQTVTPGTGSLSVTGIAPQATVSSPSITITPDTGALSFAGTLPELKGFRGLEIVGWPPTVVNTTVFMVPPVGSMSITGHTPTVVNTTPIPKFIEPGTASLTITGEPVSLEIVISGALSSLFFTGYAPTVSISQNHRITPATGSLTFTGHQPIPVFPLDEAVQPPTESLTITGYAPEVRFDWIVKPDAGSLAITGLTPDPLVNNPRQPDAGAMVLAGLTPTVDRTIFEFARPDTGSLTISGHAPTSINTTPGLGKRVTGRSRGKRRWYVEVDGQDFVAYSQEEVQQLLSTAVEVAETEEITEPSVIRVRTGAGKPTQSKAIQKAVTTAQQTIKQGVDTRKKMAQVDLEIAELLTRKIEQEEEEALLLLLLL